MNGLISCLSFSNRCSSFLIKCTVFQFLSVLVNQQLLGASLWRSTSDARFSWQEAMSPTHHRSTGFCQIHRSQPIGTQCPRRVLRRRRFWSSGYEFRWSLPQYRSTSQGACWLASRSTHLLAESDAKNALARLQVGRN